MLLRTQKTKEARDAVVPFVSDAELVKSRYRRLGLYYHGFASVLLKDNLAAGKSLGQLTPFSDPIFGTHACYLLARVHHLDGERAEATAQYQAVLDLHTKQVKEAQLAIRNPQAFKDEPDERARLQALSTSPPPDHYARSLLYLGVLHYEDGKFSDALARLTEFEKQVPNSPLAAEVHLRIGFCQVQLKSWADALKTLAPIVDKNPDLADQCAPVDGEGAVGRRGSSPISPPISRPSKARSIHCERPWNRAKGDTAEVKARRGQIMLGTVRRAATRAGPQGRGHNPQSAPAGETAATARGGDLSTPGRPPCIWRATMLALMQSASSSAIPSRNQRCCRPSCSATPRTLLSRHWPPRRTGATA